MQNVAARQESKGSLHDRRCHALEKRADFLNGIISTQRDTVILNTVIIGG